jgi:16S rRNA (guanine1207-N2)-methyltransferase
VGDHYYSSNPEAAHDRQRITTELRGRTFTFITDSAVFSRDRIDHASRLLIEAMQLDPDATVLDIGCGYGPIGIVAATLAPQGYVHLIDVNARAIELARENIELNRIGNAAARVSDGFAALPDDLVYDAILTNPPIRAGKAVVYGLLDAAADRLTPGGALWVVVGNKQGADSLQRHLEEKYADISVAERQSGFRVLRAMRPMR